jgi:very-short-patch-repair endonuclease
VGLGVAALDGVTALQAGGLVGFEDDRVHVSVRHTATVAEVSGVRVHKVIRRVAGELAEGGIPRTTPAVAAVRAAHWAVSDRQAALVMVMPVQQRLVTGDQLVAATRRVRGRTRRRFIRVVAHDIADGAQSLGELDFAALCRARGLPEPSRQVVQRGPRGRVYLDVRWDDAELVVEIDGAQHTWGLSPTDDVFRQNDVVIRGDRVLRMTLLGLRLAPDAFMDQVCRAHARFRRR